MLQSVEEIFFKDYVQSEDFSVEILPQSGSSRRNYIAYYGDEKFIITTNPNIPENKSFIYFSQLFSGLQLNTPKILAIAENQTTYLQQYLGPVTLSDIIAKENLSDNVKELVSVTLQKLYHLQQKTAGKVDYQNTFEYQNYDQTPVLHDLFYFKFMFADILELQYHKSKLIADFYAIAQQITMLSPKGLMLRDFQARNIIVDEDNQVYFIDYQSAMYGPLLYDVVSFLFQAKANFPENFRLEMVDYYIQLHQDLQTQEKLKASLPLLQLMRFLQVLGVYGFRGLVQRKPHFINSIENGVQNIKQLKENWSDLQQFPELYQLLKQLDPKKMQMKIQQYLD